MVGYGDYSLGRARGRLKLGKSSWKAQGSVGREELMVGSLHLGKVCMEFREDSMYKWG